MPFLPFAVAAIFASALYLVGRRHPRTDYISAWTAAFELLAAGWLVEAVAGEAGPVARPLGSAAGLVWLAASLLFVQGLRQRARRHNRAAVLAAIWAAIAAAFALRSDLSSPGLASAASTPLLVGIGLLLAACAVRTERRSRTAPDIAAVATLVGYAAANLLAAWWTLTGAGDAALVPAASPLAATVVYAALGVALMLLLNEDLAIALERIARTDPLTGIWNRRGFDEAAPHLLACLLRRERPWRAAVAIGDIDAFKGVNDGHGHAVGDAVLVAFAERLTTATAPGDLLARLGGEEFVMLAIGLDAAGLCERVEQVRLGMIHMTDDGRQLPRVTASFGVAELDPESWSMRDALERADRALYRAKQGGRNRTLIEG